jgi:hypothetical protein
MVTATRDRQRGSRSEYDDLLDEWGQRAAFGQVRGWPWWVAVLLALGLSVVGGFIDIKVSGSIGKVFEGGYFLGCVGAVCMVRRRNLFGPMVQAPLILAVTVPVVILFAKGMPTGASTMSKLITLGVPLVSEFPTMAVTTVVTVVIGGIRFAIQRKPAGDDVDDDDRNGRDARRLSDRDSGRGSAGIRQRPGGSGRPGQARTRDDRGAAPQDRGRSQSQARGRAEVPERRPGGGRPAPSDRERRDSRDRGQAPRTGGQSRDGRDGGQPPRSSGRSPRDDVRRQPPRRRDDDY